jgi:hypothetical protein
MHIQDIHRIVLDANELRQQVPKDRTMLIESVEHLTNADQNSMTMTLATKKSVYK